VSCIVRGLVGNPRAGSKTLAATRALVDAVTEAVNGAQAPAVDLAEFGGRVLDYADAGVAALRAELATVNLLVVATPVYKGSYTGLLKSFLDGYGPGALASVYTIPFTVAASPMHALAGPTHLQPLLDELGAISPLGGLFLPDGVVAEPAERDARIAAWLAPRLPLLTAITEASA
jgi:FMN reductase